MMTIIMNLMIIHKKIIYLYKLIYKKKCHKLEFITCSVNNKI